MTFSELTRKGSRIHVILPGIRSGHIGFIDLMQKCFQDDIKFRDYLQVVSAKIIGKVRCFINAILLFNPYEHGGFFMGHRKTASRKQNSPRCDFAASHLWLFCLLTGMSSKNEIIK